MLARFMTVFLVATLGHLVLEEEIFASGPGATSYSLDAIIDLALEHNPAISGAKASIEHSLGLQTSAGAYPNPSISGMAGRGSIRDPSTGVSITERMITVQQPLEWPAKREARQRAADAGVAGANAKMDEVKGTLVAEVKVAFYQLLLAQEDEKIIEHNLDMMKEILRTVTARVGVGEATKLDLMKATVETQKATKDLARARHNVFLCRATLNTKTAGALGTTFTIQGDFSSLRQAINLESLTARALERHPAVRRVDRLLDQAAHSLVYEKEARVPNISVQGQYHREAGDESVIGGLSIPLPLWYRRQGEIQTALATKQRLLAERELLQNELVQAVTQHTQEVRIAEDQIDLLEKGLLKQAEETLRIAKFSFRQGAASLVEVLDAQRVYRQALAEHVQARTDLSIALARLERASGGSM